MKMRLFMTHEQKRELKRKNQEKENATDETNQKRIEQERRIFQEKDYVREKLSQVNFFPGSIKEYENHVGHKVRIIDTGHRDMGVIFEYEDALNTLHPKKTDWNSKEEIRRNKQLVEQGIEAIVNAQSSMAKDHDVSHYRRYGLPVAKKYIDKGDENDKA